MVNVSNSKTKCTSARFLLDSGSQANLLTLRCCRRLGLKITKYYSSVKGLGMSSHPVRGVAEVIISSRYDSNIKYSMKVLLVDQISEKMPMVELNTNAFSHLVGIPLADDCYYKPQEIDGIIGAELFPILVGSGRVSGVSGMPTAIQTSLGYVTYKERIIISKIWAFSDSTTVLQWLNTAYSKDVFVSNRVAQIWENFPQANWRYIEGTQNPADCLSRGLTPSQLVLHPLWISGPTWMATKEEDWPLSEIRDENGTDPLGTLVLTSTEEEEVDHPLYNLILRCSSWVMILRTTVWVLRFLKLIPLRDFVSVSDLARAELTLIKLVQFKHFKSEIQLLKSGKDSSKKLRKLRPFIQDGLLRVGGRLEHANMTFGQRHPLLLPSTDQLVSRLIDYCHQTNLHTGPHLVEALLRQRYWILSGRNLIRKRIHNCNYCFRLRPSAPNQLMGDLPAYRVQQAKAFLNTGVDYFGPFNI
ncbi:hypothetical protein NQ317_017591, partial [Molorchus minor]